MRIIEVSSPSAHDRGRQYGSAAADLIGTAIEYYGQAFELQTGRTWAEILELSAPWERLIGQDFPELYDEIRGIAAGAGVSVREIVVLNCRGEIVYDAPLAAEEEVPDGCTSFSLTGGDGHVYTGQNWDWRHAVRDTVVILRIVQPPKPTIIMQVEAGPDRPPRRQLPRVRAQRQRPRRAVRRHHRRTADPDPPARPRPSISDALKVLVKTRAHIASNALLTDRSGYSIDLETTPGAHGWEYPTDGLLVHGNHYQAFVPPQLAADHRPMSPDSLLRVPRARQGLSEAITATDVRKAIRTAMSDHLGLPDSLCAHPDQRLHELRQWSTLLSSCVDLTAGEYYVAPGTPCEHEYELIPFNLYD